MRHLLLVVAVVACATMPLNMNIALVILFAIIRGLLMTAFLMMLDGAPRRLRQRHRY